MSIFLTAEWRNLINLTYAVPPELLLPYLPKGVEIDTALGGKAHVSLVAFDFLHTRLKGISVPFHINFPEINLRFYVRYQGQLGVVFIREFVPKYCIALVAQRVYNEPYRATSMTSITQQEAGGITVKHQLTWAGATHTIAATGRPFGQLPDGQYQLHTPAAGTPDHYFKEHTWGFGTAHSGHTLCYRVDHPVWEIYKFGGYELALDFGAVYGPQWAFLSQATPDYALLAKGSAVRVHGARKLADMAVLPQVGAG